MMLYTFVKSPSGDIKIVGAECSVPPELDAALLTWSQNGYVPAEESEYFQQETGVLNARIAELEKAAATSTTPSVPPSSPTAQQV